MQNKIRIAMMSDDFDRRPERTMYFRRLIERLLADDHIELTLVHSKPMPDEPLYQQAHEVLLPRIKLPYATRFLSFIRFSLTTKKRFDILYWFTPRPFPFFWLFPARHTVIMMHGGGDVLTPGIWTFSRRVFNYTVIWFSSRITAMIAVSEYGNKEIIYAYHVPPEKVRTIYNGLDPMYDHLPTDAEVAVALDTYHIKPQTYFLYIGRARVHKNVGNLVSAYVLYREDHPAAREILVLGGMTQKGYETSFGALPESPFIKDIHFIGYVPTENLMPLYRGACALSFVTLNEGFGVPLIEAMACGTPVITSSVTALPEVAGNAALIVDPHDPQALAQALALSLDPQIRAKLIERGLVRAQFFSMEKTFNNTIALLKELVGHKPAVVFDPE